MLLVYVMFAALMISAQGENRNKRVADGMYSKIDEFPYQALIYDRNLDTNRFVLCGAVIVSAFHVLSAAHCFEDDDWKELLVVVGARSSAYGGASHNIEKLIVHEKYQKSISPSSFDIAVLKVINGFEYTDNVRPIPFSTSDVKPNSIIGISGYGIRRENVPLVTASAGSLHQTNLTTANETAYCAINLAPGQMCAIGLDEDYSRNGACLGDLGGPVVIGDDDDDYYKLIGIMISGEVCHPSKPWSSLVFLKISYVRSWIDRHVVYDPASSAELEFALKFVKKLKSKLGNYADLLYAVTRKLDLPISDFIPDSALL